MQLLPKTFQGSPSLPDPETIRIISLFVERKQLTFDLLKRIMIRDNNAEEIVLEGCFQKLYCLLFSLLEIVQNLLVVVTYKDTQRFRI